MDETQEAQPAAEQPDAVTLARHTLDAAFRAFRKRATAANLSGLAEKASAYQLAQYEEQERARRIEYGL